MTLDTTPLAKLAPCVFRWTQGLFAYQLPLQFLLNSHPWQASLVQPYGLCPQQLRYRAQTLSDEPRLYQLLPQTLLSTASQSVAGLLA